MDIIFSILPIIISITAIIVPIAISRTKEVRYHEQKNKSILDECLQHLGKEEVANLVQSGLYIPMHAQEKDKPHDNAEQVTRSQKESYDLAKKIFDEVLPKKGQIQSKRFRYVILGGSGMGKSLFSAFFCYSYLMKKFKRREIPFSIHAYNLNVTKLEEINNQIIHTIREPHKSILLLDSIDENREAIDNYSAFWEELNKITDKFRVVIITCRTQFYSKSLFEGNANNSKIQDLIEPSQGSIKQPSSQQKYLEWDKHYIAPFTKEEIENYLIKKYRLGSKEYTRAHEIIFEKTGDLMSRPLLLSYLDDILEIKHQGTQLTSVQIYNEIINRWFQREITNNPIDSGINMDMLYSFTKKIAAYIYSQNRLAISEEKFKEFLLEHGLDKDPYNYGTRSLLNRTSAGEKKFAHKSFLEYFMAINSIEHPEVQFNLRGFDAATSFAEELYKLYVENKSKFIEDFVNVNIAKSPLDIYSFREEELMSISRKWEESLKTESSQEYSNVNIFYLFALWEELIPRVPYLLNKIRRMIVFMISLNNRKANTVPINLIMKGCELEVYINSGRLREIQTLFTFNNLNINLNWCHILAFKKKSEEIEQWLKQSEEYVDVFSIFPNKKNSDSLIIFPAIHTEYNKEEYVLSVGNGFVNDDSIVLEKVKRIYEDISDGHIIYIYKEVYDMQEQVDYINKIMNIIEPEKSKKIVVGFYFQNLRYYYLIDKYSKQYSLEKIMNCLNNLRIGASMHKKINV